MIVFTCPLSARAFKNIYIYKNPELFEQFRITVGGDKRDRTADLLNAIQALSQLSYTPWTQKVYYHIKKHMSTHFFHFFNFGFTCLKQ